MSEVKLSSFAETIFKRTYAFTPEETWEQCAARVARFVADGDTKLEEEFYWAIATRKFMPGGRYLYSSGRELPQLTNCFLIKCEDSREGWASLLDKHLRALSTGGGVGVEYSLCRPRGTPIKRYGGESSGPIALMKMVNEVARHVMAGGKRRSALWAGLAWDHADIEEFIAVKNWSTDIKAMKEKNFDAPAALDMTNISVRLDSNFFKLVKKDKDVWDLYYRIVKSMCKTGEPAFSVDLKEHANEHLRNPCQPGWATVLTPSGIRTFNQISIGDLVWTGECFAKISNKVHTGKKEVNKYHTSAGTFIGTDTHRVVELGQKIEVKYAKNLTISKGPEGVTNRLNPSDVMDGLVLGDGTVHKASNNLVLLNIGNKDGDYFNSEVDSLIIKHRPGVGPKNWEISTTILHTELPRTFDRIVPDRFYYGETAKKLGFLRGLFSANGSVIRGRVTLKQTSQQLIRQVQEMLSSVGIASYITENAAVLVSHRNGTYLSKKSYNLNILSDRQIFARLIGFIHNYKNDLLAKSNTSEKSRPKETFTIKSVEPCGVHDVYDITVDDERHVYWTGGILVSNCCEITSSFDNDCCNLGSVVLPRIDNLNELKKVVRIAVRFLYRGTFKGWMPHDDFAQARASNRRIGLGIMGLHDWCLKNHLPYEPNGLLGKWLSAWANITDDEADKCAKAYNEPRSVATRAVAPTGTISIVSETTGGIEPLFCGSYKRRFLDGQGKYKYSYVIDPTAERAISEYGVAPDDIEDAYSLASNVEKRIAMQMFVQDFTDQAISSTINLPEFGEPGNNNIRKFAETLLKYLPRLRGITCYPDGSRPGQPITPVKYETAKKHADAVFEEEGECKGGVCGL